MLSVLVLSPNPSVPGGVSAFIECMKRHVTRARITSFDVGSKGRGREAFMPTLIRLFTAPVRLIRLIRSQAFDVVHINPSFDVKSLVRDGLFVLALRLAGYHHILIYLHGFDFAVQRRIKGNVILRFITAWVFNQAALILVLGNKFRDGLIELGVEPKHIAVTCTMYEIPAAGGSAISARPFILFMSRFDVEKGGRELMQAFAAMARDYPDIDLVMAGDGDDADICAVWL